MSRDSLAALSDDPVLRQSAVAARSLSDPAEDRRSYTVSRDMTHQNRPQQAGRSVIVDQISVWCATI
jgi:hypothetical protein